MEKIGHSFSHELVHLWFLLTEIKEFFFFNKRDFRRLDQARNSQNVKMTSYNPLLRVTILSFPKQSHLASRKFRFSSETKSYLPTPQRDKRQVIPSASQQTLLRLK